MSPRVLPPLPAGLVDFESRGFRTANAAARALLERRAGAFLTGYNTLRRHGVGELPFHLGPMPLDDQGFAYEGAAFAACAHDVLLGRKRNSTLDDLFALAGDRYPHLMHVGAGWVGLLAPPSTVLRRAKLDPLLRWLTLDGAGFSRAFLRGRRWNERFRRASWSSSPSHTVLHQGVGRAMWFMECADPAAIRRRIAAFPPQAHAELWSGVGLAVCYAGGADHAALDDLTSLTGPDRVALAQGAAFAAGARGAAGHVPEHTATGVRELAGVPVDEAVEWTVAAAHVVSAGELDIAAYRQWQHLIRDRAARHV
ncbi:DUF1702 family protein [Lentzea flaviverrucosa]|uniref:DUF1702 family protein n=1 Tax=Lentzea flaviverrucosa TaxID=200379 RepID=A0A1H9HJ52_9PSEU|nr:DUF1702 family protein [Lentzea flaviverrucosa]RDI34573.1 uncharacterized protein DUF1702 [Lentzea flaviverrucosa]SEQ62308.1 Protein of unknown function [Lentzea flaviverrucosa]